MHADEANQAIKAGELLEAGRYEFDPADHHGPTLYYAALPIAWLRGERTLASLTETTLRLVPALAGTVAVVLLGILATPFGRWPALAAAAFLAVSPPAVYYSRYFVQETLVVTLTLAVVVSGWRWWAGGRTAWAVTTGACLGLMLATKLNSLLFIAAAVLALVTIRPPPPAAVHRLRHLCLALGASIVVLLVFYSSFGTHPRGVRDWLAAFVQMTGRLSGDTGHEKPWWYYLHLFTWQRNGGLLWEQRVFFALACGGFAVALGAVARRWFSREKISPARGLLLAAAIYTLVVVVVLSSIAYKTPWHAIHFVPGFALLAAGGLVAVNTLRTGRFVGIAATALALGSLSQQTWRAAFLRPADQRNPYAYVHTAPDILKFRPLVEAALARHPDRPVRIISEEYWPLPWYLRGLPGIGYWHDAPDDCEAALIVTSALQYERVKPRLQSAYGESLLGLRPNFICFVLTRE